ncbi:beta-glucuronidase [Streptobacillus canis]|uniref:beta-glucuronidase n=1 Tax=Streptobacillus canis TaxID=2678686 RepID=UPI0012E2E853|nr:beta-glucuronidase [Streptobacillus canis]
MLYPLSTLSREIIELNGIWDFQFENDDMKYMISVPGSFNDQFSEFEKKHYVGNMTYTRKFTVSKYMLEKRIYLRFGSVSHIAKVYVNNELVGEHKGGFTPFEFEITDVVSLGENKLEVLVSNVLDHTSLPVGNYKEIKDENGNVVKKLVDENFDFFNYSGIHRPVKLWIKPKNHIEDITITYDVLDNNAKVNVKVDTIGSIKELKVTILDEENNIVASGENLNISNVRLWEPLNAYLYKAKVELINENNEVEDEYIEEFGIRTVEVKNNQFLINGKPFYFKGFGKHEDTYLHGRGLDEVANVVDISRMKWLGANTFRTSHYPYSEEMMRLADREGIVVIDETTAVGLMENFGFDLMGSSEKKNTWETLNTTEAHEQVIRELIKRDKNHACVVMWSIANEPSTAEVGAHEYFEPLFKLARSLDPQNRPCTFVNIMLAPAGKCLATDLVDVICLNRYYGWYVNLSDLETAENNMRAELEYWHQLFPDKPIMFTEYGADTIAGMHDIDIRTPFTEEFQIEYYKMNEKIFDELDYFVGEQTWNFADFQTKFGIFRVQGNKKGVFTRDRAPKFVAHHLKQRWNNIPEFNYKKK